MALSFKERMALRAAGGTAPLAVDESVEVPAVTTMTTEPAKPVRRFGAPKDEPTTQEAPATGSTGDATGASEPAAPAKRFGGFKFDPSKSSAASEPSETGASAGATTPAPAEVELPAQEEDASPLPQVIQAFNAIGSSKQVASNGQTEGELLSGKETPAAVREIQQKIHELSSLNDVDLRYEMTALQGMLTANPSACLYLLDEDTGRAVRALRRMTNNRVAIDMASAKPASRAKAAGSGKPLTAAEMASAMDDL